ncbi:MAG TPA: hypothetical protein VLT36_22045 [Candidatus Dormibacteraeota bacterium]|nr:hypothetical protein [Candidatus Dormibacteraeota bacterium]
MSRVHNAARSLASGYAAMVANVFYTLASVPLALHYLSKEEFGLWALVAQIGVYLTLLDLGMSGSVARILIDHKDTRSDGVYGAVLKTGCLVLLIQGACIILGGGLLSLLLPGLLKVPAELGKTFQILVAAQCLIMGITFVGRILMNILQAHQRYDSLNYSQIGQLAVGFATQWLTFHWGWGLYSLLAAAASNYFFGTLYNLFWVVRLRLFPERGHWGKATMGIFHELWSFGKDLFVLSVGLQLLNASQVVIISRTLGLDAAATWTIATRTFQLAFQFVQRVFDFSSGAFAEMIVRQERATLRRRFRDMLVLSASLAVFVSISIAVCNGSFVALWTRGRIQWPLLNDALMGIVLLLTLVTRCFVGLTGCAKQIGMMRWVYFVEGVCFVIGAFVLAHFIGIAGVIISAIAANLVWSGTYGVRWAARYLEVSTAEISLGWLRPALQYLALMLPVSIALSWLSFNLQPLVRLLVDAGFLIVVGLPALWFIGLNSDVRGDVRQAAQRMGVGAGVLKAFMA